MTDGTNGMDGMDGMDGLDRTPDSGGRSTRWAVVSVAVVLVITAVLVAVVAFGNRAEVDASRSGTVVTYDGREYWVSGYEVADSALGEQLATDVPFQEDTADVRAVQGQDAEVTVAAYLPALSSSLPRPAWLLVSTDSTYWTDQANVDANASLFAQP